MKVRELIAQLMRCDPDAIVVLSRDSEGNGFQEARNVEPNMTFNEAEVWYRQLTPKMREQGYTDKDVCTDGQLAVVLWP